MVFKLVKQKNMLGYSDKNMKISINKMYNLYIVLLPIISFYRVPFMNFGWGIFLLFVFFPYIVAVLIKKKVRRLDITVIVYFSYLMIRSIDNIQSVILYCLVLLNIFAASETIDIGKIYAWFINVSIIASAIILIQKSLYLIGVDVSFTVNQWLLSDFSEVNTLLNQGTLVRTSGIFMEPSHFAQYVIVGFTILLFEKEKINRENYKIKIIIIFLGVIVSTSGLGILSLGVILGIYFLFCKHNYNTSFIVRLLVFIVIVPVLYFVILKIPIINLSITRVFGTVDSYNAIAGRSVYTDLYLSMLHGFELFFGVGYQEIEVYLTGAMTLIYRFGIVGICSFIIMMGKLSLKQNRSQRMIALYYMVIIFGANVVGFLNYLFYLVYICGGKKSND